MRKNEFLLSFLAKCLVQESLTCEELDKMSSLGLSESDLIIFGNETLGMSATSACEAVSWMAHERQRMRMQDVSWPDETAKSRKLDKQ